MTDVWNTLRTAAAAAAFGALLLAGTGCGSDESRATSEEFAALRDSWDMEELQATVAKGLWENLEADTREFACAQLTDQGEDALSDWFAEAVHRDDADALAAHAAQVC